MALFAGITTGKRDGAADRHGPWGEFFEAIEFQGLNHQSTFTASLTTPHTILILQFQWSPITMQSRSLL